MVNRMDYSTHLPRELMAKVEAQLKPDEKIVWQGQPIGDRLARRSVPSAIMGLFFTSFALFCLVMAVKFRPPHLAPPVDFASLFPVIFTGLFVLIGLRMLLSPLAKRRGALKIVYVLTDRRALVLDASGFALKVRSYTPAMMQDLSTVQNTDGSGDVIMESVLRSDPEGGNHTVHYGFIAVASVKEVEAMVRKLATAVSQE